MLEYLSNSTVFAVIITMSTGKDFSNVFSDDGKLCDRLSCDSIVSNVDG